MKVKILMSTVPEKAPSRYLHSTSFGGVRSIRIVQHECGGRVEGALNSKTRNCGVPFGNEYYSVWTLSAMKS